MALSITNKKQFNNYVVDSLVEKYDYSKNAAQKLVTGAKVMADLENNPEKAMNFDAEFIAEKLVAKNRLN